MLGGDGVEDLGGGGRGGELRDHDTVAGATLAITVKGTVAHDIVDLADSCRHVGGGGGFLGFLDFPPQFDRHQSLGRFEGGWFL